MSDHGAENPADSPDRPDRPDPSADSDLDVRFADIVAHFDDGSAPTERSYAARPGPSAPARVRPPGPAPGDAGSTAPGAESTTHGAGGTAGGGSADDAAALPGELGRYAPGTGAPATHSTQPRNPEPPSPPAAAPGDVPLPVADTPAEPGSPDRNPEADESPAIEVVVPWRAPSPGPGPDGLDEHFVPPIPEPLPAGDLQFWAIIVGMVGGPLLLLYLTIFARDAPSWWMLVAVAATAGGFGLLVSRLPAGRDDEDDGARV